MERSHYIGGTDAKRILDGDWLTLYEEKLGLIPAPDLSKVFKVQLGKWTEPFHAKWLEEQHGLDLREVGFMQHKQHPFIAGSLDRLWPERSTFVELKHTNERSTVRDMVEWYQPQVAHYCAVLGVTEAYLSFIAGNEEPQLVKIEPGADYISQLIELEVLFWWHVENRMAPDNLPSDKIEQAKSEASKVKVNGMRFVNMTGNNQWAMLVNEYMINEQPAKNFEAAKKGLKELIEPDVAEATGYGLTIKRSKSGSLLFSKER